MPSVDTLDRDKLSVNFVRDLDKLVPRLAHWHGHGQNHVLFNMYFGSWPDYSEALGLDAGAAIIAKASFSTKSYRINFDVSFPLFHADWPAKSSNVSSVLGTTEVENLRGMRVDLLSRKPYLLTFKGKRYLNGIGSATRNALYHLNNKRDVLLLTTCKHGSNWVRSFLVWIINFLSTNILIVEICIYMYMYFIFWLKKIWSSQNKQIVDTVEVFGLIKQLMNMFLQLFALTYLKIGTYYILPQKSLRFMNCLDQSNLLCHLKQ